MKVSELVHLSCQLKEFSLDNLLNELSNIKVKVDGMKSISEDHASDIAGKLQELQQITDDLQTLCSDTLNSVDAEVINKSKPLFDRVYKRSSPEHERANLISTLSDQSKNEIAVRASRYTSWQHPVLEIGPGDGRWTDALVAGDPLYLVDIYQEFLDSTTKQFNEVYKRKVRCYLTGKDAQKTEVDLSALPKQQFGFIFAWEVFDYLPNQFVEEYLKQCYELLKPGGVMMFSYNNCEEHHCADFGENQFKHWMPKWFLLDMIKRQFFEVIVAMSSEDTVHWVEIKKPGTLTSIVTSQTLAQILPRPGYKNVDIVPERTYNKQQIGRLKQIAIQMKLDATDNIMLDKHTPHQLSLMIEKARNQK